MDDCAISLLLAVIGWFIALYYMIKVEFYYKILLKKLK